MSYLKRISESEQKDEPVGPRTWQCMCNGCPVIAGIDAGNGQTICRFHFGEPASVWQEITRRLRERGWLVRLVNWLYTGDGPHAMSGWGEYAAKLCESKGRPELSPSVVTNMGGREVNEADSAPLYANRLNATLTREVFTGLDRPTPLAKPSNTAPVKAFSALPEFQ